MDSQRRENLTVVRQADGLIVQGAQLQEEGAPTEWNAVPLDDKRILLVSEDVKSAPGAVPSGVATCATEVFKDFFIGLHYAGWSGVVSVDTGYGVKKVYFTRGDIVFAASNIMDDRLGEVIYREARITLDELTNSAAQVTKSRKFGQVLISSGIFTNMQLWQALKLQVKQILRSLFMVDRVYFELQGGLGLAPTEVIFQESVPELAGDCFSFGCTFRAFLGRLRAESEVALLEPKEATRTAHAPGTFTGDLIELIEQQANVQELLNTSKLIDPYTVAAVFSLMNQGFCAIMPEVDDGQRAPAAMAPLKAKFDGYSYVLQAVRKAFADAGKEFPVADVRAFATSLNPEGFTSVFLDPEAAISRESISGIISQCSAYAARIAYFSLRVESLIQFLLQVAGDNLAFPVAKQIRQDYRAVTA